MTNNSTPITSDLLNSKEKEIQGFYGPYKITVKDKQEVMKYRLAVLLCSISYAGCLCHWWLVGPSKASIWLIAMAISLGLSLKWIHIYLRPLHQLLQFFWALGSIGIAILIFNFGLDNIILELANNNQSSLLICPLFVALTGLGFKEFFCFRRVEAIGVTLLLPTALLGYLSKLLNGDYVISMLFISAILLVVLAIRKFGMDEAADIGDKSVFEYLANKTNGKT